jgi:NTP pyrophosphatase (non-canonical NTP hydrolase)
MIATLKGYEICALETALYPQKGNNILYPALKLAGEAGEFADKVGKYWRNTGVPFPSLGDYTEEQRRELLKELGDVLWYITACANELDSDLETVANMNINKLRDRNARGVIKSEGDNR